MKKIIGTCDVGVAHRMYKPDEHHPYLCPSSVGASAQLETLALVPPAERIPPAAVISIPIAIAPVVFPEVPGELASVFRNLPAAVS